MDRIDQIDTFCRHSQVSRETIKILEKYEFLLIKANKNLNLIGKSTLNQIWFRHFLDSFQVIDFINKNDKVLVDIGSGAGFPGIIIAIIALDRKISLKIRLIEKSPKKSFFLNQIVKKLKLNVEVMNVNVQSKDFKFFDEAFVARAFRPLPIILELIHSKAKNIKKIIIFLGKRGHEDLLQASKNWDIKYKQRMSLTSDDSFIIEIDKLEKKKN